MASRRKFSLTRASYCCSLDHEGNRDEELGRPVPEPQPATLATQQVATVKTDKTWLFRINLKSEGKLESTLAYAFRSRRGMQPAAAIFSGPGQVRQRSQIPEAQEPLALNRN